MIWCHCLTNKLENKVNSQTSESEFCFIFSVQTEKFTLIFFSPFFLFRLQRNIFYCLKHSAKRFCSLTVVVGILHYVAKNKQMYCTQLVCSFCVFLFSFMSFEFCFYLYNDIYFVKCLQAFNIVRQRRYTISEKTLTIINLISCE